MKTIRARFEGSQKEYTFNVNQDVKVGDRLLTSNYKTEIVVSAVNLIHVTHFHIGGKNVEVKVLDIIKIN